MLLIGIWMSLTKNPMNPIIAKPIAVAMAIFWNSTIHTTTKVILAAYTSQNRRIFVRHLFRMSPKSGFSSAK